MLTSSLSFGRLFSHSLSHSIGQNSSVDSLPPEQKKESIGKPKALDLLRNRGERASVGGGRTAGTAMYNEVHEDSEERSAEAAALRSEAGVGEHSSRHRQTALLWLASLSRFPGTTLREPTPNHVCAVGFARGLLPRCYSVRILWTWALLWITCFSGLSGVSQAALSPEVTKGLVWLEAQIQADGHLSTENTAIATPHQTRSEVERTASPLTGRRNANLIAAIQADTAATTENLARKLLSTPGDAAVLTLLLAKQNLDGGFGGTIEYQSNPLDTAWALLALKNTTAPGVPSGMVAQALGYLQRTKNTDGSWDAITSSPSTSAVQVTGYAMLAAASWSGSYPVGSITLAGRDALLALRTAAIYTNTLDNAVGLLALLTQTTDTAIVQPLATAIRAKQLAEGSWDGDPFLTALAIRALAAVENPPPAPTTGGLTGTVVDASSSAPLIDVTIQCVEAPEMNTTSDASGKFALAGMRPGIYTLQIAKVGYRMATASNLEVKAGQETNLGSLRLNAAALTATVTGTVKDSSARPLTGAIIAVGTASTITDANGKYLLSGIPPGLAAISATLTGYTTATPAPINFEAGKTYNFSPTLYSGAAPVTVLRGKTVNSITNAAIVGASVKLGANTITTGADGSFSFSGITAGPFSLDITAISYTGVTASGVTVDGVNDLGNISLVKLPAATTLTGKVTDVKTGSGLAGATVSVAGSSATTDVDGKYTLNGITTTNFDLIVSAAGYLTATKRVTLTMPGNATLDVALTKVAPAAITIDSVTSAKATYLPTEPLEITVVVRNTSADAAEAVIDALVLDASNNVVLELKANAHGLGNAPPNLPISVAAASTTNVDLSELLLRRAAGTYSILARAYDTTGRVIAEGRGSFTVSGLPVLSGGVIVDPPLTQASSQIPVHFTGELTNLGNQPIPAGDLTLTVTLENVDTTGATAMQTEAKTLATGAPLKQLRGAARDTAGNLYTVSGASNDGRVYRIAPDGTTTVAVQIPTVPNNPYLADVAIDGAGNIWIADAYNGTVWKVDSAGTLNKITLTTLTNINGIDLDSTGNLYVSGRKSSEHRLVKRNTAGNETILWANGLVSPQAMVRDANGDIVITNNDDGTLVKVHSTGEIVPFVTGLNRPVGITMDSSGNFYVANNGDNSIVKITPAGTKSVYATGLNQPIDLRFDGSGNLFVSCQGDNAIRKVTPAGVVSIYSRSAANQPLAMKYDATGNLLISDNEGILRRLDATGQITELATGLSRPNGIAFDTAGTIFVTNYSSGAVSKVTGAGKSTFVTGLAQPSGIALDNTGNVLVAETSKNRLNKYDANGALLERINTLIYQPIAAVVDKGDNIIIANYNGLTIVEAGVPRVFFSDFGPRTITPDPAGGAVFLTNYSDVYRITYNGTATKIKTLPFSPYGIAADGAGNLLFANTAERKIYQLDTAGSLTVLATTTSTPRLLSDDGAGKVYLLLSDNSLVTVAANGTLTPVTAFYTAPNWDYPTGLGIGADGKPLVWTNNSKIISVDPATGAQTVLKSGVLATGATTDRSGNLYTLFSSDHILAIYNSAGTETARWSGFATPTDIVWDGGQYWFVDNNHIYTLAPAMGSYPVRRANQTMSALSVDSAGVPLGVSGGSVYRWNGSAFNLITNIAGTGNMQAIARRADGGIAVADAYSSRIVILAKNLAVENDYVGINSPTGLAFDTAGRLYVGTYGSGGIARFAAGAPANSVPTTFARTSYPSWLNFDPNGKLWVSNSNYAVNRFEADGTATQISNNANVGGLLVDTVGTFALNKNSNQLLRWDGSRWNAFAAGLNAPEGLRALADGSIVVTNRSNGTLVKWQSGSIDVLAAGLNNPHDVDVAADGKTFFVSGDQGEVSQINADGTVKSLNVRGLLGTSSSVTGLVTHPDGRIFVANESPTSTPISSMIEIRVTQPITPPAAGTVVYQKSVPASLPVGEGTTVVDFSTWIPPYSGDFRAQISRPGLTGSPNSTLHVGPAADGQLTVNTPTVPPGSPTVGARLKITGADFSALSRVETALVKPTVKGVRPNGMTADRAGNIYATEGASLRKTTPVGVETVLGSDFMKSGYSFGLGLAIDNNEQIYAPVNAAGTYQLVRFDLEGKATVLVANLGAVPAGVAVNSRNEIFVALPGKLLLVAQDGSMSTFTTIGIASPVGISIDGKDNIYVLNNSNIITQIRPDHSSIELYSKGDGVDQPSFEYEGMALAADCGENFYLAPFAWAKVGQNGEEYTVAQINPRTGQAGVVLDGRKIHNDLLDMDYITFDRFGARILLWTDYSGGRIWQIPVTCGAISVEAHLVTTSGQTLTSMSRPPAAAVPLANGGTEYVWSLRDVTAAGAIISFDTLLKDLALGEARPLIDNGFLLFKNTFVPGDIKLPLSIPIVRTENLVQLTVTTDQPKYAAKASAKITSRLVNNRTTDTGGVLTVDILDQNNVLVGSLPAQGVTIAAGASTDAVGNFAIGTIVPGFYSARATLKNGVLTVAQGTTRFEVMADTGPAKTSSQLQLDKVLANAADRITITSRALNTSTNVILTTLSLNLAISDPSGNVRFTKALPIAQLIAGSRIEFTTAYSFTDAAPGVYTVQQTLQDAAGITLDTQSKTYQVAASTTNGFGLIGTISANPSEVPVGAPVSLAFTVKNNGNAAYTNLPLTLRILNPVATTVLQTFPMTTNLAVGSMYLGNQTWTTVGQDQDVLIAALSATMAGQEIPLAQQNFVLRGEQPKLEFQSAADSTPRVLALAACSGSGEGNETDRGVDNTDNFPVYTLPGQSNRRDSDSVKVVINKTCGLGRAQSLDDLLDQMETPHLVTTDLATYQAELRTGAYSTTWISGQTNKLSDAVAQETIEATFSGAGLLVDGVYEQRHPILQQALAAAVWGKSSAVGQPVVLTGPVFNDVLLDTLGHGLKLTLNPTPTQGKILGYFGNITGNPAIIANPYGQGRAQLTGIDLVASLPLKTRWPVETARALNALQSSGKALVDLTPGAYLPILLTVKNPNAESMDLEIRSTLPTGAGFVMATPSIEPPPISTANRVVWRLTLAAGSNQTIRLALRAPLTAGNHSVQTEVALVRGNTTTRLGALHDTDFTVAAALDELPAMQNQLLALPITGNDKVPRNLAMDHLSRAQNAITDSRWADAVDNLINAVSALTQITGTDTSALRLQIDRALQETQWRYTLSMPRP